MLRFLLTLILLTYSIIGFANNNMFKVESKSSIKTVEFFAFFADLDSLSTCYNKEEGLPEFDLSLKNDEVLGANDPTDFTVLYFLSEDDAENNVNSIDDVENFQATEEIQLIYAALLDNDTNITQDIVSFELVSIAQPYFDENWESFEVCKSFNYPENISIAGFEPIFFDEEEVLDEELTNDEDDFRIFYFTEEADAQNFINDFDDLDVDDIDDLQPEEIEDLEEEYTSIVINATNFTVDSSESFFIYFVAIPLADSACANFLEVEVNIFEIEMPVLEEQELCVDDVVDITGNEAIIFTAQQTEDSHEVRYYTSLDDAEFEENEITDPQEYDFNDDLEQEIWVRLDHLESETCFEIESFNIFINELPEAAFPTNVQGCDSSDEQDGFASFNLAEIADDIIADNPTFEVDFFTDLDEANDLASTEQLPDEYTNVTAEQEFIIIRILDTETGCFSLGDISLNILGLSFDEFPDLMQDFTNDLNTFTYDLQALLDDEIQVSATLDLDELSGFYLTEADANLEENPIVNPQNFNPANPVQEIFVRYNLSGLEDCFIVESFTLEIIVFDIGEPEDLIGCTQIFDDESAPLAIIDLTENDNLVLDDNDEDEFTIEYFTSLEDAQNGENSIGNPAAFETENPITIYVNLISNVNENFFFTESFEIVLFESPVTTGLEPLVECSGFDDDDFSVFDLTDKEDEIFAQNDEDNFELAFYNSFADAQDNENEIADPENYILTVIETTIYYKLTNTENEDCNGIGQFTIGTYNVEIFTEDIPPLLSCEIDPENNPGFSNFNLTGNEQLILGIFQSPTLFDITYYNSEADAQAGENEIEEVDSYENTIAFEETIWFRIENNNSDGLCFEVGSFQLGMQEGCIDWSQAIQDGDLEETDSIVSCEGNLTATNQGNFDLQNVDYQITICPEESDDEDEELIVFLQNVTVQWPQGLGPNPNFSFAVYDGIDTNAEQLAFSTSGPGSGIAGTILASEDSETGCLTVAFQTGTYIIPGFPFAEMFISFDYGCRPQCQDIEPSIDEITAEEICSEPGSDVLIFPVGEQIFFSGSAETSNDTNPAELNYIWLFSNGLTQNGPQVDTSFFVPGIYEVTLRVVDEFLCEEEVSTTFIIGDQNINVSPRGEQFDLDELIGEVMVGGGGCANVNNIEAINDATQHGQGFESMGYFSRGCSDFPFDDGIVLGSGSINGIDVGGFNSGTPAWPGDTILGALGGSPNNTNNATVVEFEFSSFEDVISFNYIFASQEYPGFVCSFADVFAFIISGPFDEEGNYIGDDFPAGTPGIYVDEYLYNHNANPNDDLLSLDLGGLNIATVPDQNGNPVPTTPTNIHDNENCGAGTLGEFSLPQFYAGLDTPYHAINGETRPLTASADVIPCTTYKLKLMVADWSDHVLDSYVFIEGGSFDIGVDLGDDVFITSEEVECYGEEIELSIFDGEVDQNCEVDIEWFRNGELIEDENEPILIVTLPGTYEVFVGEDESCASSDSILIEFLPVAQVEEIDDYEECDSRFDLLGYISPFDMVDNGTGEEIEDPDATFEDLGLEISFYESAADAQNMVNPIEEPSAYFPDEYADFFEEDADGNLVLTENAFPFEQTTYVRIVQILRDDLECGDGSDLFSFNLIFNPTIIPELDDLFACPSTEFELGIFDLTENDELAQSELDEDFEFEISYFNFDDNDEPNELSLEEAQAYQASSNPETVMIRIESADGGCVTEREFDLLTFLAPSITTTEDLEECGDFTYTQTFDLTLNNQSNIGLENPSIV